MHRHPRGNSHGCVPQPENMMRAPVRAEPLPEGRGDGGRRPGSPKRPAVSLSRCERALGALRVPCFGSGSIRWRNRRIPLEGIANLVWRRAFTSAALPCPPSNCAPLQECAKWREATPAFAGAEGKLAYASLISTSTPAARSSFISASTVCGVGCTMSSMRL